MMSETLREQLERQMAEPLHYVSQEARYFVLDALACHMHNKGYFIQGCTEEARSLDQNGSLCHLPAAVFDVTRRQPRDSLISGASRDGAYLATRVERA